MFRLWRARPIRPILGTKVAMRQQKSNFSVGTIIGGGLLVTGTLILAGFAYVNILTSAIYRRNQANQEFQQKLIADGHTCTYWCLRHIVDADPHVRWCGREPCVNKT